jgi:hypothetical protein
MTILIRNVITDDTGRRADYDGSYSLLEDRGDTMLIQVHDVDGIALATLLAVTGTVTVQDAANAVGLAADELIHEAEAWAAAQQQA